ncbi:MAG: ABC transporter permease [Acholeplasmataceae bacterium]|jgi:sodium transport system permease protein|nr:ABC transporter permease [Acholeplasmataceae bacterium]
MRNIWIVMKKELARVFKDKKLIFTTFILPGLVIFLIYTIMGAAVEKIAEPDKTYTILEVGLTEKIKTDMISIAEYVDTELIFETVEVERIPELEQEIKADMVQLLIHYDKAQNVMKYYYNDSNINSLGLVQLVDAVFQSNEYTQTLIDGESVRFEHVNLSEVGVGMNIMSMILPMLIITFLFQGAISVGPESIAGDKERGTIATLLATPTKRSQIALGKILSLSILAVLASLSSFIGIILSLPKLMAIEGATSLNYTASTYFFVLIVLISSVLVVIALISNISAFARNVKEAASLVAPIMIVAIVVGMLTMYDHKPTDKLYLYLIPIYNTAQLLKGAFSGHNNMIYLLIGSTANLAFAGLLVFSLTVMFNSEKRMFTK